MAEILIIMLIVILVLLYLLLRLTIGNRVIVTIVESLPIGIFRDKNVSYETENKVYVKEIHKDDENKADSESAEAEENGHVNKGQDIKGEAIENISIEEKDRIVYWTPNGKTYHISSSCFALSRSKVIEQGTIEESEKDTLCDLCKDYL